MSKVIAPKISSKLFSYAPKSRIFVAELSDFPDGFNPLSQIYDDACDAGFTMMGQKTGVEITFTYTTVDRNSEGEIQGYRFHPIPESLKKHPEIAGVTVLCIND